MNDIKLNNFIKMTPEMPQYSEKNQHYLIANANPTYYLDTSGIQEEQLAPLIASHKWKEMVATLDGHIISMTSNSIDQTDTYSLFVMTSTSMVYAIEVVAGVPTSLLPLNYPSGTKQVNCLYGVMTCVNDNLYASHRVETSIWKLDTIANTTETFTVSINIPALFSKVNHGLHVGDAITLTTTGALPTGLSVNTVYYVIAGGFTANQFEVSTAPGGAPVNTAGGQSGVHTLSTYTWTDFLTGSIVIDSTSILEPFLDYCILNQGSQIYQIDSSFALGNYIDLGTGWNVNGMKNYNDKYLAIAGSLGTDFEENYLFLWNGIDGRYNFAVRMPGKYIDMKVIDGTLYIAISLSSDKTAVFYLKGTNLVQLFIPQVSKINQTSNLNINSIFNYKNTLGVKLSTTTDITNPLIIYGSSPIGLGEFIFSASSDVIRGFCVGNDGLLYGSHYVAAGTDTLYYYPSTNTSYYPIFYKSQWVPVKNLQGIDIIYDTPPQAAGDLIDVTIYGKGENIISGTSTTALTTIDSTNYLNKTRTRLDVQGFTGDKCMIQLSTTNPGTWRPIIREVNLITQ